MMGTATSPRHVLAVERDGTFYRGAGQQKEHNSMPMILLYNICHNYIHYQPSSLWEPRTSSFEWAYLSKKLCGLLVNSDVLLIIQTSRDYLPTTVVHRISSCWCSLKAHLEQKKCMKKRLVVNKYEILYPKTLVYAFTKLFIISFIKNVVK